MTETATEITPEELEQARQEATAARAEVARLQVESARLAVLRKHPQLSEEILHMFQGSPEEITAFGEKLAAQTPVSNVSAPVTTPGADAVVDQQTVARAEYTRRSQQARQGLMEHKDASAFYGDSLVNGLGDVLSRKKVVR